MQAMLFCSHVVLLGCFIMHVAICYIMLLYAIVSYIVLCYYLYILPYMKSNPSSFSIDRLRLTHQTYQTSQYQLID